MTVNGGNGSGDAFGAGGARHTLGSMLGRGMTSS
jgi:hypothetical protein